MCVVSAALVPLPSAFMQRLLGPRSRTHLLPFTSRPIVRCCTAIQLDQAQRPKRSGGGRHRQL